MIDFSEIKKNEIYLNKYNIQLKINYEQCKNRFKYKILYKKTKEWAREKNIR